VTPAPGPEAFTKLFEDEEFEWRAPLRCGGRAHSAAPRAFQISARAAPRGRTTEGEPPLEPFKLFNYGTSSSSSAAMPQTAMDKVKLMVGMEPSAEPELLDELNNCFELTRMQRLYGFCITVFCGIVCSFLASLMWLNPRKFAILYTLGNVLSLGSTGFLTGFWNQLKNMFKGTRFVATLVYLGAMVMTLVSACYFQSFGMTLVFLGVQWCALVWYCLSYIPYGRQMVGGCLKSCFGGSGDMF
jgi:hypothetical protein